MPKFHLVLLIHAHQPVGNFEEVFERSYRSCYRPFLDVLDRHPRIRLGLHFSGPLLQWLERAHPEYFDHLRELCRRGQAEMIGGGFYEPILIAIPLRDRLEQIKRLADYIENILAPGPEVPGSPSVSGSRNCLFRFSPPAWSTRSLMTINSLPPASNNNSFTAITLPKICAIP